MKIKIIEIPPDSEIAKRFQESAKKHEAISEGIRAGKNIAEIAKELGMKLMKPLIDEEEKRKKTVINIVKEMKNKRKYKR